VYAVANAIGVRRLASSTYEDDDVNLVRLLDMLIKDPGKLWACFERYYPEDVVEARARISNKTGELPSDWESSGCKRLLSEDRKAVLHAAEKANRFASKRAAHSVPSAAVSTTFSDLDESIDTLKRLTEKYTRLVLRERHDMLEPLHRAGKPTIYPTLAQMESNVDLLEAMRRSKLPDGWDSVFLEAWAKPEIIALSLGEMIPPKGRASGG
jgi:hypothetical protein